MYFPYLEVCLEQLREATAYALSSLLTTYVIDGDMSSLSASVEATYYCFVVGGCFTALQTARHNCV